jgi:NAD-dependent deacetylase
MASTFSPQDCAERLQTAKRIGVLTGAGLSTAAGVPDFRGPKGLYVTRTYDPEAVFAIDGFDHDPRPFFAFSRDFLGLLSTIKPTFTHRFLARLEAEGRLSGIVTQNIDGLHQTAGSKRVLAVHGDYETAHCRACGHGFRLAKYRDEVMAGRVPRCECGGVVKPDIVFFGEAVREIEAATELAEESDFFLVLGSSLAVYPAAGIPDLCPGDVWVVNRGTVPLRPGWRQADTDLDEFFRETACHLGWPTDKM